jgi:hypothetical protein
MLLHRYFNSHAFETLKRARLKTSRISSFNDSFEFLYFTVGKKMTQEEVAKDLPTLLNHPRFRQGLIDSNEKSGSPLNIQEVEQILKDYPTFTSEHAAQVWQEIVEKEELPIARRRQIIDADVRAICFADPGRVKTTDELLLWSHYGKKHEGIRIGFEFPGPFDVPFQLSAIEYQEKRVQVVFSIANDSETFKSLLRSAIVKCKVWEYEKEYRLFAKTNLCVPEEIKNCDATTTVEHFLDFKREWVKFVDFGVFCPESEIHKIITLLKTDYPNAVARKAEFHKTEYALEYIHIH